MPRGARVRTLGRWALVLALLLWAAPADAHRRSLSYSNWSLEPDGARVHVRVSQLDLSRLGLAYLPAGGPDDPVAAYLATRVILSAGEEPCLPTALPTPREAPEGWAVYAWRVRCPGEAPRTLASTLFLDVAPSHLHFARVDGGAGGGITERVLSEAARSWSLAAADTPEDASGTTLGGYLMLGVEHILTGWDHLAFVLALLILAGTLGEVAALVTSFTVAHSVTLGLATLGWVRPDSDAVESLIGFSIALVAAENGWILGGRGRAVPLAVGGGLVLLALLPEAAVARAALLGLALFSLCHFGLLARSPRPARLRAAVAFAFGLVHGFGFAGVLAEMELPTARLVPALFGFNVGVELGQLAVVLLAWPLLRAVSRWGGDAAGRRVAETASAAICGLGLYWFVVRAFG
jgi:hypothetical protein